MKKFKFLSLLIILIGFGSSPVRAFLTQEDIEGAKTLAASSRKLEDFTPSDRREDGNIFATNT